MRNRKTWFVDPRIAEKKNVQIERPRSVRHLRCPVPPILQLDRQQLTQQSPRLQLRLESDDSVHKSRLLRNSDRLCREERGPADHAANGFKPKDGSRQSSLRRPCPTGQIASHADVSRVHEF